MDKRYVTGTIFLTIAVVVAVVFLDSKYREMITISDAIQKKEAEFKGEQILIQEVGALNKEFSGTIKALEKVDEYIPASKNIADLLLQLDYMSSRNGLVMKDVSFPSQAERTSDSGKYSVVFVNLSMAGSYSSFINFADDVKSSIHLMNIVSFDIKAEQSSSDNTDNPDGLIRQEPVLDIDINLEAYYQ